MTITLQNNCKNFIYYILLTIITFLSAGSVRATPFPDLIPISSIPHSKFVDLVSRGEYDQGLRLSDSLIHAAPADPGGYFLALTALNNRTIDYEYQDDMPALTRAADSVTTIADRRIAAGDSSALVRFYRGSVEGFRMIHFLRDRSYVEAIRYGKRAADWLEQAVKIDPTVYDAYVGLGNYYYFKSKYSGVLRATGIVSDQREEGKRLLALTAENGLLTKLAAISSLAWIAVDEEKYDTAIVIASSLVALYPENRAFLWCLGSAQLKSMRWNEAIKSYSTILNSIKKLPNNNHHNELSCLHSLSQASFHLENWSEVINYTDQAFALRISDVVATRKEKDLNRMKKIRTESIKKIASNSKIGK